MTPQQLQDLPGYGKAQTQVIQQGNWDYDYPSYFIERVAEITATQLTEDQKQGLIDVYENILEGAP